MAYRLFVSMSVLAGLIIQLLEPLDHDDRQIRNHILVSEGSCLGASHGCLGKSWHCLVDWLLALPLGIVHLGQRPRATALQHVEWTGLCSDLIKSAAVEFCNPHCYVSTGG